MTESVPSSKRLARNVIASSVDTLSAELMQDEPRALFSSVAGTWETQNRARNLTSYAEDMCDALGVADLREQYIDDGLVAGMGIMRPYIQGDEIYAERIFPANFLMDDRTCVDVVPRSCYVRRYVDRDQLAAQYPANREAIKDAALPEQNIWVIDNAALMDRTFDVLEVIEGWHLPSSPGAGDGKHVVCIADALLHRADYDRQRFPFAFFRPVKPPRGFWGESLVQRAAPAQLELNKQLRRLQHIHHLTANGPIIFMQTVGGAPVAHITNDIGTIVPTPTGQAPTVVQLPGATPEMYNQLDRLQQYIMQEFSVNEMQTQGTKPVGISSGKALRLLTDTTSRKYIKVKRSAERSHVDFCRELIVLERELSERCPEREVLYERYGAKVRMPWSKVDIEEKFLRIKSFPVSALSSDPGARMEQLQEMRKDGALSAEQFWRNVPGADLEDIRDEFVAPTELLQKRFGIMLEDGKYIGPEPYMNLGLGIEIASRKVQAAEVADAPEDRLDLLRQWITDAKRMMQRAEEGAAPPPMAMAPEGMPPPGMGPMGPEGMMPPGMGPPMPPPGMGPPMGPEGMPPEMMMPPPGPMPGE